MVGSRAFRAQILARLLGQLLPEHPWIGRLIGHLSNPCPTRGLVETLKSQSGRQDSNLRPSAPKELTGGWPYLAFLVIPRDLGDAGLPCPA
jgi:hypothetical protein